MTDEELFAVVLHELCGLRSRPEGRARGERGSGFGLGLWGVHQLVSAIGGWGVRLGDGPTFIVVLPIRPAEP